MEQMGEAFRHDWQANDAKWVNLKKPSSGEKPVICKEVSEAFARECKSRFGKLSTGQEGMFVGSKHIGSRGPAARSCRTELIKPCGCKLG